MNDWIKEREHWVGGTGFGKHTIINALKVGGKLDVAEGVNGKRRHTQCRSGVQGLSG